MDLLSIYTQTPNSLWDVLIQNAGVRVKHCGKNDDVLQKK